MLTSLDAFREWLGVNRGRLFRGLRVIETDRLIRVRNRIDLLVDLVFREDDILLVVSEDVGDLDGELGQLEISSLKRYSEYKDYTRLASELGYWLELDESGFVYYKEVGLEIALKSYLASSSFIIER